MLNIVRLMETAAEHRLSIKHHMTQCYWHLFLLFSRLDWGIESHIDCHWQLVLYSFPYSNRTGEGKNDEVIPCTRTTVISSQAAREVIRDFS
jgi:hypothetical protein